MTKFNLPDIEEDPYDCHIEVSSSDACLSEPLHPLMRLWILRGLACLDEKYLQILFEKDAEASVFEAVGLNQRTARRAEPKRHGKKATIVMNLRALLESCEGLPTPTLLCLDENVMRLASLIGLSELDCRLLTFVILMHSNGTLSKALRLFGSSINTVQTIHVVSALLGLPRERVRHALSQDGLLARSGLVKLDRSCCDDLHSKLEILSDDFATEMQLPNMALPNLLRGIVNTATAPKLKLADYQHVAPSLAVLKPYLSMALASSRSGVNILVHGAPGTGKSQLAKVLAAELSCELFEVACEDDEGEPIAGEKRLRAFGATQCFFGKHRSMIVFDEMEDVFNDSEGLSGRKSTAQTRKGWVNRTLESNGLPTFWLSIAIDCLDPAFIRRFDMVLELPVPPRRQRERIIQSVCGTMLDAAAVTRLAESENLTPAVIARAASVVSSIQDDLGEQHTASAIELLVNQTLQAQGHPKLRQINAHAAHEFYDPALVHADADLSDVARGLLRAGSGRLCLYGPPGTGKTAYGRWLADQLQVPLHVKRASDLLSMYVGGNEQNIAEAFTKAREDGAVLLMDEVDSFLQDRRHAQHSWESTLVNEMLTQIEAFPGVFVASTNLMEDLDQAALRRFDIKVKFDYLAPEQAWQLLVRHCEAMGLPAENAAIKARLARLDRLTPGDFSLVARQHGFRPLESSEAWLKALEAESRLKGATKAAIGFF